jgi:hypothetical protein
MTAEERSEWMQNFAPPFNYALFNNPLECYTRFRDRQGRKHDIIIRDFNPDLETIPWAMRGFNIIKDAYSFPPKCQNCNLIFNKNGFCKCTKNQIISETKLNYKMNKYELEFVQTIKDIRINKIMKSKGIVPIQSLLD